MTPVAWPGALAIALLAAAVPAQTAKPDAAPVAPPALEGYRSFSDEEVRSWKEANDTVGRIGGWRAYGREAQANPPAGAASAPAAPASGAAPGKDPHAGHH
jgi:hypothetical protein